MCNQQVYLEAYDYEVAAGLFTRQDDCKQQVALLMQQQFGPASAFEVMSMVCKGACDAFSNRVQRLRVIEEQTGCACADLASRCPRSAPDFLCAISGFCYDADWYQSSTCAPSACGRWATNEADYRSARRACNLYLDAGATASVARAALAVMASLVLAAAAGSLR
jgi:hypothetical protein